MSTAFNRKQKMTLAVTAALMATALNGCAAAPEAKVSAQQAQVALEKGKTSKAVGHAEAAVRAAPRDAQLRTVLGATYMEAGRFKSAATSFKDAMALGDTSARTALSYSLAEIAAGNHATALRMLESRRDEFDAADYGLALSLAGQPQQGVHVLRNALAGGQNTAKVRQNLAYSYALAGDWRSARVMAAEDVPADKINDRIAEWAQNAAPGATQQRVAGLLGVPVTSDNGQPVELALANHPSMDAMVAEAAPTYQAAPAEMPAMALAADGRAPELPALAVASTPRYAPAAVPVPVVPQQAAAPEARNFDDAFGATREPARVATPVARPSQEPGFIDPPMPRSTVAAVARTTAAPVAASAVSRDRGSAPAVQQAATQNQGDYLVQLGSFSSEASAKRAWDIYKKRYPQLSEYQMVITQARVRGKMYWRVSAGGFERTAANGMCSSVKTGGHGCIAWADGKPLPGALDRGVRMARR